MNDAKMTIVQVSDLAAFEAQRRELLADEAGRLTELLTNYSSRLDIARDEIEALGDALGRINARLDEIRGTERPVRCEPKRVDPDPDPEAAQPDAEEYPLAGRIAAVLADADGGMRAAEIAEALGQPATVVNPAAWRLAVGRTLRAAPKRFRRTGKGRATRYHLR